MKQLCIWCHKPSQTAECPECAAAQAKEHAQFAAEMRRRHQDAVEARYQQKQKRA